MGIFKHSPGCGCCGCLHCQSGYSDTVDLVVPDPSEVTLGECSYCNDIGGTYTLSKMTHNGTGFDSQLATDRGFSYWYESTSVVCGWEHVITGTDNDCFDYPIYLSFAIKDNATTGARFYFEMIDTASPAIGRLCTYGWNSATPSDWNEDADCTANLLFVSNNDDGSWAAYSCAPFTSPPQTNGVGFHDTSCDKPYCEWVSGANWELNP